MKKTLVPLSVQSLEKYTKMPSINLRLVCICIDSKKSIKNRIVYHPLTLIVKFEPLSQNRYGEIDPIAYEDVSFIIKQYKKPMAGARL